MSKKKLSIISLKKGLLPQFRIFIRDYWNKNHIFSKENKVLSWFYYSKTKKKFNFFIAIYKKKIVGAQGYIPFITFDKNLSRRDIFLAFWRVIKTDIIGLGYLLHKKILENSIPDFIGVIGINNELLKFHKWQGFNVKKMNHHVYISQYKKKFEILVANFKNKKLKVKHKNCKIHELKKIKQFNKIDNQIFNYQIPLKSKNYLINRYLKCPFYQYRIFLVSFEDYSQSVLILRKLKIKKNSMFKIVDYIGNNSDFAKLDYFFDYLLKKNNSEFADIYSYGLPERNLSSAGFKKIKLNTKIIAPNHFEPLEKKNIDINCAFKSSKKEKNIRIFRGDGDGDRPSIIKM